MSNFDRPLLVEKHSLQQAMIQAHIDGWLLYDFRASNRPMYSVLGLDAGAHLTRRLFYWLPAQGSAVLIRHAVDGASLVELEDKQAQEGKIAIFTTWQELESILENLLQGCACVAMEVSPRCALPYLSCVDAGTVEWVESMGPQVVSSQTLLQGVLARFDEEGLKSHLLAARALDEQTLHLMGWIHGKLARGEPVSEWQAASYLQKNLEERGMHLECTPIVAVGPNSADPHYTPTQEGALAIEKDQVVLIDVWCRQNQPRARWADICRMAFTGARPSDKQQEVFDIVFKAQTAAIEFLRAQLAAGKSVQGHLLDRVARALIEQAGFGAQFTHRLGHSIELNNHGAGTHLDGFETRDERELVTRSCFSVEPGIYLAGEFGVRLESDLYIDTSHRVHVTGGHQKQWYCLDPSRPLQLPAATSPSFASSSASTLHEVTF